MQTKGLATAYGRRKFVKMDLHLHLHLFMKMDLHEDQGTIISGSSEDLHEDQGRIITEFRIAI